MAFKLFSRRRSPSHDAEPFEMGPVKDDEEGIRVRPGEPVPYDATSWLPPTNEDGEVTSAYRAGPADIDPPEVIRRRERPAWEPEEEVHTLRVPEGEPDLRMTHGCLNCGFPFKVPRGRPVEVVCPDCGARDVLK